MEEDNVQTVFPGVEGAEGKDLTQLDKEVLKQQMVELKNDRITLEEKREIKKEKTKAFDEENKELIESIKAKEIEVANQEKKIKEKVVAYYKETKDTNIPFGIKIQITNTLGYNPKEALDWAVEHKLALALDVKTFKDIVKSGDISIMKIVKKGTVPKATIPTKIEV